MLEVKIIPKRSESFKLIYVEGEILKLFGERIKGYFLIDTGATLSIIHSNYSDFLRDTESITLVGVTGQKKTKHGILDIEIGGSKFTIMNAVSSDFKPMKKGTYLGIDFLIENSCTINLVENILHIN